MVFIIGDDMKIQNTPEEYLKHFKRFIFDFKVQPGEDFETYMVMRRLMQEPEVRKEILKKMGVNIKKTPGKGLTADMPEYNIILNHFLDGISYEDTIAELAEYMHTSERTAERTYKKNKANIEKTALMYKNISAAKARQP